MTDIARRISLTRIIRCVGLLGAMVGPSGCRSQQKWTISKVPDVLARFATGQDSPSDRLAARPGRTQPDGASERGLVALGLDQVRDALLYVPADYQPDTP